MSLLKALLSNQTKSLFKTQIPLYKAFFARALNSSSQKPPKTPLSLLFQEDVNNGFKRKVRNFKENLKGQKKEKKGLYEKKPKKVKCSVELYEGQKKGKTVKRTVKVSSDSEEVRALKNISQAAEIFIKHLYAKGYFNKASFLEANKLDFGYFRNSYGRDFIKFAAYSFGKDHQDIAKWLSGNHLKKVALFGCPSLDKNNVFASKRLRKFFKIQEDTVCSRCMLKDSCEYANKSVWGIGTNSLLLVDVMKVITLYALDQVPAKLSVPDEVKDSIDRLLKMVIKLSQPT